MLTRSSSSPSSLPRQDRATRRLAQQQTTLASHTKRKPPQSHKPNCRCSSCISREGIPLKLKCLGPGRCARYGCHATPPKQRERDDPRRFLPVIAASARAAIQRQRVRVHISCSSLFSAYLMFSLLSCFWCFSLLTISPFRFFVYYLVLPTNKNTTKIAVVRVPSPMPFVVAVHHPIAVIDLTGNDSTEETDE